MAFTTLGMSGVNFNQVDTASGFTLGTQVFGSDGKIYVYAKAAADISANDADCSIDATTFAVTASGGAYKAPNVAVATGSYAWFGKAGV
jgi:hypothetical protein